MLLALAWRNLWRNARRTVITMTAIALGVAGIIGLHSYRDSIYGVMVRDITDGLVGHLQVHGQGYQAAPSVNNVVRNPQQLQAVLTQAVPGATSERRVMGAGLAGAHEQSAPVMVIGLAPREVGAKGLHRVVSGKDLSPSASHEVLLGRDLARDLDLTVGGELVLVGQAADGSVANDRYTVVGTFTSSSAELDAAAVLLHLADAQDFFALGDAVHQLVVRLPRDDEDLAAPLASVRAALDLSTVEALSWGEILPEFKETMRQKRSGQHAMDAIVLLIVALGVFNAMSMSTFERTREFGVLAALGTRPRRLLSLVLTEALLQGLLAFSAGLVLATVSLWAVGTVDLSTMLQGDVMGARLPSHVVLALAPVAVASAAGVAFGTVVLGALLPALRAARLRPVEAMRHT